jgi:hypothetical protein
LLKRARIAVYVLLLGYDVRLAVVLKFWWSGNSFLINDGFLFS